MTDFRFSILIFGEQINDLRDLPGRVAIEVGEANVSIFGEAMGQNILTPNFESEFKRCF